MEAVTPELALMAINCGPPFLISGPNGVVHGANQSFCELVGYSEVELQKKGWIALSVDNEELQADEALAQRLVSGQIQAYQQWKSYKTRYGTPIPGQLMAVRYPEGKDPLQCCLCFFIPLVNGSKAALEITTEYIRTHTQITCETKQAITQMMATIEGQTKKTKVRAVVNSVTDWAEENPKLFLCILLFIAALNPFPLLQNWIVQQGWLPAQPVQIQIDDKKTGQVKKADKEILNQLGVYNVSVDEIANLVTPPEFEVTTPNGTVVSWIGASGNRSTLRCVSSAERCLRRGGAELRLSAGESTGHGGSTGSVRNIAERSVREF